MHYREHRCPCDVSIRVTTSDGKTHACVVVNVSERGARLARLCRAVPGQRLRLVFGNGVQPREAEVRWSDGVYTGVRFALPMAKRDIAVVRQSVSHASTHKAPRWNTDLSELR